MTLTTQIVDGKVVGLNPDWDRLDKRTITFSVMDAHIIKGKTIKKFPVDANKYIQETMKKLKIRNGSRVYINGEMDVFPRKGTDRIDLRIIASNIGIISDLEHSHEETTQQPGPQDLAE